MIPARRFNQQLRSTLQSMLRPIVRLAIGKVSFHGLVSILEELFYELGYETAAQLYPGRQVSNRLIGTLTGLGPHRISLLRRTAPAGAGRLETISDTALPEASVLEAWWFNPAYSGADGQPKPLPIEGPEPSFETLVREVVSPDASPSVMLDSLARVGAAKIVNDKVVCRGRFFSALRGLDESSLVSVSHSYLNFSHSVEHNLSLPPNSSEIPWPQRERWSRWIPEGSYPRLKTILTGQIDTFTETMSRVLETYEAEPKRPTEPTTRYHTVGVGVYFWEREP